MTAEPKQRVRRADASDAQDIGRLLDAFGREFDDPGPGPEPVARRMRELLEGEELDVLLAGEGPDGLAVLRYRPNLYSEALECYLAELYVVPERRGQGLGLALMQHTLQRARERGADRIELGTTENDVAARALYERMGFTRHEGEGGPLMFFYERELRPDGSL